MMLPQKPIKWLGKFLVEKACWILLQYVHNVEDNACIGATLSVFTTIVITRGHSRTLHVPTPTRAVASLPRQALGKGPPLRTRFTIITTPIKTLVPLSSWGPARPPLSTRQYSPCPALGLSALDWCQCTLTLVTADPVWACVLSRRIIPYQGEGEIRTVISLINITIW